MNKTITVKLRYSNDHFKNLTFTSVPRADEFINSLPKKYEVKYHFTDLYAVIQLDSLSKLKWYISQLSVQNE